jgi:hypothetical protein
MSIGRPAQTRGTSRKNLRKQDRRKILQPECRAKSKIAKKTAAKAPT